MSEKNKKARPRFELGISSLLVRRFNQLSHRAAVLRMVAFEYEATYKETFCLNKTSFVHSPVKTHEMFYNTELVL